MRAYIKLLTIFAISVFFAACNNDQEDIVHSSTNSDSGSEKNTVLRARNPNLPTKLKTRPNIESRLTKSDDISGQAANSYASLGSAYRLLGGNFILGDYANVRGPVVDIDAVKAYDKSYILGKKLSVNESSMFAYSNFERYQYNSTITKTVKSGFKLKIKLFSIGKEKTTKEVFTTIKDHKSENAYGELSINFKNSSFNLQVSDASRKLYARQFLTKSFIRSLYNSSIYSTLESYGDFVLTGYVTGGKAYAAYAGESTDKVDTDGKEKDITSKMDASFSWKKNSTSGDISFTGGNHSSTTNSFKDENTHIYIKTLGGKRDGSEAVAKSRVLKDLDVNLTYWMNSLNDVSTHTMIDLTDNGLYPMSDFVLEQNFKQRFDDTGDAVLSPLEDGLLIPYIEIVRVFVRSTDSYESLYDVAAVLVTRQGDKIILSDGKAKSATDAELRENEKPAVFNSKVDKIMDEKSTFFSPDIQMEENRKTRLNPILRSPLTIDLTGFKEQNFYTFYYDKTDIMYIYDPKTRLCFSIYCDEGDDEVLDLYGIRDWVESLPEKKISIASLANSYKIIGL